MVEVRKTEFFVRWLDSLRDVRARARVLARIERLASGNPGDVRPVGEGVSELRINYGPGYRVYFKHQSGSADCRPAGRRRQTHPGPGCQDSPGSRTKPLKNRHEQDRHFTIRRC